LHDNDNEEKTDEDLVLEDALEDIGFYSNSVNSLVQNFDEKIVIQKLTIINTSSVDNVEDLQEDESVEQHGVVHVRVGVVDTILATVLEAPDGVTSVQDHQQNSNLNQIRISYMIPRNK
jgi:hypothetical protein